MNVSPKRKESRALHEIPAEGRQRYRKEGWTTGLHGKVMQLLISLSAQLFNLCRVCLWVQREEGSGAKKCEKKIKLHIRIRNVQLGKQSPAHREGITETMITEQCQKWKSQTKVEEPAQGHHTRSGVEVREVFSKLLYINQLHLPKNYCSLGSLILREKRARGNVEVLDHKRAVTNDKGLIPEGTNNRGKGCRGDCKDDRRGMLEEAFLPHSVERQRSKNMNDMGPFVFRIYSVLGILFWSCLSWTPSP